MNAKTPDGIDSSLKSQDSRPTASRLDALLAGHPFLTGLSPHQIRLLTDCAMVVNFQSGELIYREGDPANRFYLIQRGKVALERQIRDRGIIPVQELGAGETLGWSWLFPPCYWHFDARAVEPTEAVFFYGTPLREQCETDHDLGYELIKRMSAVVIERLRVMQQQLIDTERCQRRCG